MRAATFVSTCGLLCALFLAGCGQSGEIKREKFSGEEEVAMHQAAVNILGVLPDGFHYKSMVLYKDDESSIIGLAREEKSGYMIGNSVNVNLMIACEFYEPIDISGDSFWLAKSSCDAIGTLDGPKLNLAGVDDCGFCGMGASISGTFIRFAEIVFDYDSGKTAVKQVYKLK